MEGRKVGGECRYCGADDWFPTEDGLLCGQCYSPEMLESPDDYAGYLAKTGAEQALNRKRFTEGREPDEYETPEYYDRVWAARRVANRPDGEPFWRTLGR